MKWETLLCIGDSITIGARSYLGYPEYLGSFLEENAQTKWNVLNNAICGYTCMDICRDLTSNFTNLKEQNPSVITILIGTNDLKKNTDRALFKIAYNQLIIKAKLLLGDNNIILIKVPMLAKGVKYPYKFQMNEEIPKYNKIIAELAKQYSLPLLELNLSDDLFYDGVHLNEAGSKKVAEQILSFMLQDKGYAYPASDS